MCCTMLSCDGGEIVPSDLERSQESFFDSEDDGIFVLRNVVNVSRNYSEGLNLGNTAVTTSNIRTQPYHLQRHK